MAVIDCYKFSNEGIASVRETRHYNTKVGENWPVVYVLNNDDEAYVGETVNAARRMEQHLLSSKKSQLTEIKIITDDDYNKSVILDLEAFLIKHMCADGKFVMLNGNNGIQDHEYYDKNRYEDKFKDVWNKLRRLGVVSKSIEEIENSELFKYSPYKSLGEEQIKAENLILRTFAECRESGKNVTIIVRGGAGTGKTILAVYLMKLLADINNKDVESTDIIDYIDEDAESISAAESLVGLNKIGIVLPQKSLRTSMTEVFKSICSLSPEMVLNTTDVVENYIKTGEKYDLLIVDEAHRLKCRNKGNIQGQKKHKDCNIAMGLDEKDGTELDWIIMCSKHQIFFRDEMQKIRESDIGTDVFKITLENSSNVLANVFLDTQWRCKGGNEYTSYIENILKCRQNDYKTIQNYELLLFEDVEEMIQEIKSKDKECGLCRTVAGYAWEWKSKKKENKHLYDIEIGNKKYRWNTTYDNWIVSPNALNEIGCIHTVQGYDLNYCGVIIGDDIKYNKATGQIFAEIRNYYDSLGRCGLKDDPDALRDYLTNIYLTLMTRGIKGTYVYVCDENLREYMKKYIKTK